MDKDKQLCFCPKYQRCILKDALVETIAIAKARLELTRIAIEIKEANKSKKKSEFAFWKK